MIKKTEIQQNKTTHNSEDVTPPLLLCLSRDTVLRIYIKATEKCCTPLEPVYGVRLCVLIPARIYGCDVTEREFLDRPTIVQPSCRPLQELPKLKAPIRSVQPSRQDTQCRFVLLSCHNYHESSRWNITKVRVRVSSTKSPPSEALEKFTIFSRTQTKYVVTLSLVKKFYNFYLLNCDTLDFYKTELLNFNFNQPERTQRLYYEPERRSDAFRSISSAGYNVSRYRIIVVKLLLSLLLHVIKRENKGCGGVAPTAQLCLKKRFKNFGIYYQKVGQVGTAQLYIRCPVDHYYIENANLNNWQKCQHADIRQY
ncbi:hypothetical protein AGLY_003700 [Aphis glycines]|uniref:Uncharacterized protein n=1 Tax=Aphis glycines TaxID=307491 RepID=A0A6G0TYY4_APHGL|nr:hypothetical protein AGLY_003700 [Aphis glycines]